jgi:hypothetical protein
MKHHSLVIARVTMKTVENPNHLIMRTAIHVMETQGISSRMHKYIDLTMSGTKATTRTRKQRWGRHALPTGFTERKYPRVSNYLMISKNMTDHKNLNHGYPTIFRP